MSWLSSGGCEPKLCSRLCLFEWTWTLLSLSFECKSKSTVVHGGARRSIVDFRFWKTDGDFDFTREFSHQFPPFFTSSLPSSPMNCLTNKNKPNEAQRFKKNETRQFLHSCFALLLNENEGEVIGRRNRPRTDGAQWLQLFPPHLFYIGIVYCLRERNQYVLL
jgi:hypothetical protein